jgi:hypothetical protein
MADVDLKINYLRFQAGSRADPKPAVNPREKRLARCVTCRTIIVHFSRSLGKWVDDGGRYHTGHMIEFPQDWIPEAAP